MLEILQFYVSGFWVWVGITTGIYVLGSVVAAMFAALMIAVRADK